MEITECLNSMTDVLILSIYTNIQVSTKVNFFLCILEKKSFLEKKIDLTLHKQRDGLENIVD